MTLAEFTRLAERDLSAPFASLVERGLVAVKPDDTYAFSSGVIRHVAYDSADPDDRRHMHKRIAAHSLG